MATKNFTSIVNNTNKAAAIAALVYDAALITSTVIGKLAEKRAQEERERIKRVYDSNQKPEWHSGARSYHGVNEMPVTDITYDDIAYVFGDEVAETIHLKKMIEDLGDASYLSLEEYQTRIRDNLWFRLESMGIHGGVRIAACDTKPYTVKPFAVETSAVEACEKAYAELRAANAPVTKSVKELVESGNYVTLKKWARSQTRNAKFRHIIEAAEQLEERADRKIRRQVAEGADRLSYRSKKARKSR